VAGEWAFTRNVARSRNWHFVTEAAGAAAHLWPCLKKKKLDEEGGGGMDESIDGA
jgi:hypothetical protein